MAIGCGPDVTGNVTAGAICVSCPDRDAQCAALQDQQYGRGKANLGGTNVAEPPTDAADTAAANGMATSSG